MQHKKLVYDLIILETTLRESYWKNINKFPLKWDVVINIDASHI